MEGQPDGRYVYSTVDDQVRSFGGVGTMERRRQGQVEARPPRGVEEPKGTWSFRGPVCGCVHCPQGRPRCGDFNRIGAALKL